MAKEEKKKDVFFRIVEMRDGLKEGITSIEKTINGQNDLIEFLKTAPENKFKDLIIDLISQNENLKQQKEDLEKKYENINKVVEECENDEVKKSFVSEILQTFIKF